MSEVHVTTRGADDGDEKGREIDDDYVFGNATLSNHVDPDGEPFPDPFSEPISSVRKYSGLDDATKQKAYRRLKKSYDGKNGAKSKAIESNVGDGYSLLGVVEPPYNLEYLAKLYTRSSPHYAAVQAKVSNIVGLGYDFVDSHKAINKMEENSEDEEKKKDQQRKMAALRSKTFDWLDECNDEDEFDETLNKVYVDYETTGNGYFEIGRDIEGKIHYIGHIPAKTMRIRRERDGYVQVSGEHVRFFRNFGKDNPNPLDRDTEKEPNEVIHIKKYSPDNSFYGVPDIIAALDAVAGDEFATRYNLDYFDSKAVPRYMVVIKGGKLGAKAHKDLIQFFDSAVKGTNHRTIIIPMPADVAGEKSGIEMNPIEAGVQDSSFVNYDKTNLRKILMAERVPMTKVGLAEGVNLAVARDADKTFKEQVCRPDQRILEKKLSKIFKERTDLLRFKLNELTLTDEDTQSKIDERYLRMQTVVPNEVRARWGKTGLKGGDDIVDLKAQAGAEAAAKGNRTRDAERSAGATDSAGEGRNPKGEGRTVS
jgi:PBSX family phage portal protein